MRIMTRMNTGVRHLFVYGTLMSHAVGTMGKAQRDRLQREGRLDEALLPAPPVPLRILYFAFGYAIILLGLFLLVFGIANAALLTLF